MSHSPIYYAVVTKVAGPKLYVRVPALGGDARFGPLNSVILLYKEDSVDQETFYEKGDTVIVAQVGRVKEDLVVLGRIG